MLLVHLRPFLFLPPLDGFNNPLRRISFRHLVRFHYLVFWLTNNRSDVGEGSAVAGVVMLNHQLRPVTFKCRQVVIGFFVREHAGQVFNTRTQASLYMQSVCQSFEYLDLIAFGISKICLPGKQHFWPVVAVTVSDRAEILNLFQRGPDRAFRWKVEVFSRHFISEYWTHFVDLTFSICGFCVAVH